MSSFDRDQAIEFIVAGTDPATAIALATTLSQKEAHIVWMVKGGGPLAKIPDPVCVANMLRGNESPSREDVEAALIACGLCG